MRQFLFETGALARSTQCDVFLVLSFVGVEFQRGDIRLDSEVMSLQWGSLEIERDRCRLQHALVCGAWFCKLLDGVVAFSLKQ